MFARFYFLILLLSLAATSCEVDRSAELEFEINKRVAHARKQYLETCANRTMVSAEKLADSLLLAQAKLSVNDSLRNRMPSKPLTPAAVAPIDSLQVAPLFEKQ